MFKLDVDTTVYCVSNWWETIDSILKLKQTEKLEKLSPDIDKAKTEVSDGSDLSVLHDKIVLLEQPPA